jgi:uncharacterized protein (UPF0261 family)
LKTVLCIATLDTKGPEMQYAKEIIGNRGLATLVMDDSCLGPPPFSPDITAADLADAAGSSIEEVRTFRENGPATTQGFLGYDREGAPFYDPVADRAFTETLKRTPREEIPLTEIDANLPDEGYADVVIEAFSRVVQPKR